MNLRLWVIEVRGATTEGLHVGWQPDLWVSLREWVAVGVERRSGQYGMQKWGSMM